MRFTTFVFAALGGLLLASPALASAADACGDGKVCPQMAACCNHDADQLAASVLLPQEREDAVRQTAVVWFMRPVKVGDRILLGKYIVEHDTDRMARGLPCTHIYEASDQRLPVVGFHCRHLDRTRADHATVTLRSLGDPTGLMLMTEFQFAGDAAAHGVPGVR